MGLGINIKLFNPTNSISMRDENLKYESVLKDGLENMSLSEMQGIQRAAEDFIHALNGYQGIIEKYDLIEMFETMATGDTGEVRLS